jgi:hypothetical protein
MSFPGPSLAAPSEENDYQNAFITRLVRSFARVTGGDLVAEAGLEPKALGRSAYFGDFALLSHRGGADAVLNYGNAFSLRLWECDWDAFTSTPSAATAPQEVSGARGLLMQKVSRDNFVSGYCGERISRTGRRFLIEDVTVWRLLDEAENSFGMAAFFRQVRYL